MPFARFYSYMKNRTSRQAHPLYQHVTTNVSSPAGFLVRGLERRQLARSLPGPGLAPIVFSIRPPQSLFPTRLKSSHRRRNARLVALSIRACSPKSNHSSEVDECCKVITNKKKPKYATCLTFDNNESLIFNCAS